MSEAARMDELIAKLEAAAEGSRDSDIAIAYAIYPQLTSQEMPGPLTGSTATQWYLLGTHVRIEHYTTSIDAALTLVPEGWEGHVGINRCVASLYKAPPHRIPTHIGVGSIASTPALALCIASLKARASSAAEGGAPESHQAVSAEDAQ